MSPLTTDKSLAAQKEGAVNATSVAPSARHVPPTKGAGNGRNNRLMFIGAAACLVLGVIVIAAFARSGGKPADAAVGQFTAQRQPLPLELHEVGSVEALNETALVTRFTGDIVWMIQDGAHVEPGDPVVRFETKTVVEDIEAREKDLFIKKEALRRAEANLKLTEDRYKVTLRQQQIELEKVQLEHDLLVNKPKPEDRLDAELTLKQAQLDLERSALDVKNFQDLAKQGFASDAKLKEKQLDLATKNVNFVRAKGIFDLTVQGATTEDKRVAEMAVADAKKRVNIEKFNREADLAVCKATVDLATVDLRNFERELTRRRQDLEWATVRATVPGHIVFTEVFKGSAKNKSPIQVGEQRMAGGELGIICDTSSLKIRVHVNESNVKDIAVGQRARVTLQALPGQSFEAVVGELAVVAQDKNAALSSLALRRSGEAFVNVVQAKLNFINMPEEARRQIRVGFTADVYIQTGDKALVLAVPWKAVKYDSAGLPYALVEKDGQEEKRTLKIGRAGSTHVEVLNGLNDHDIVRDLNATLRVDSSSENKELSNDPKRNAPGGS